MKNRTKYIIQRNEYDLLVTMQHNLFDNGYICAIDVITGEINNCPAEMKGKVGRESKLEVCKKCIQKWLNTEV